MASMLEEESFDANTRAEVLRLSAILNYCDAAHIGVYALRRSPSMEALYAKALSRLDRVPEVFDECMYEEYGRDDLLLEERMAYEKLLDHAKEVGVPSTQLSRLHYSSKRPYKASAVLGIPKDSIPNFDSVLDMEDLPSPPSVPPKTPRIGQERPQGLNEVVRSQLPLIVTTEDKELKGVATVVDSSNLSIRTKNVNPSSSVSSFFTSTSVASSTSRRERSKRRVFQKIFGLDSRRASYQTPGRARNPSQSTDGELVSPTETLVNGALGSVQSSPTSIRSSTSSSLERFQGFDRIQCFERNPISSDDRRKLAAALKSEKFTQLQRDCQQEADRFMLFAAMQRAALPLIFGRNRLHITERRAMEIDKLEEKHIAKLEELENRLLDRELAAIDEFNQRKAAATAANATALRHVNRRLSLLGENATEEDRNRLEEEKTAMIKWDAEHKRILAQFNRDLDRQKMTLLRKQKDEMEGLKKAHREEWVSSCAEKRKALQENMHELEQLISDRKGRLHQKWYLQLQIFKYENDDLKSSWADVPLPLSTLGPLMKAADKWKRY